MGETAWYFIGSSGEKIGPLSALEMRRAVHAGEASRRSLAWREGMTEWQPLAQLARELGLATSEIPTLSPLTDPYRPPQTAMPLRDSFDEVAPAGFVRRWAALVVDTLVLGVPLVIVAVVAGLSMQAGDAATPSGSLVQGIYYLGYILVAPLYYAGLESSVHQATLGKRALGIKVADMDGRRIGFGNALGRWFAALLSYLTVYVGFLMAIFTDRKRALHDFVAGTQVVDRWAYTDWPERQKHGLSGCLVAFLIAMLSVPVLAILAAISISQYQDYAIRAQVSEAASLADRAKVAIGEHVNRHGALPGSNAEAGLPLAHEFTGQYVSRMDIGEHPGHIIASFSSLPPQHANSAIAGMTLVFSAELGEGSITWTCRSEDLKQKWCPRGCSCQ